MRRRKDECLISDYRVTSENAKGVQLCGKKIISSIKGVSLNDDDDDSAEPPVTDYPDEEAETPDEAEDTEESLDEADETEPPSPEDVIKQAEDFRANAAETLKRVEEAIHPDDDEDAGDLFRNLD